MVKTVTIDELCSELWFISVEDVKNRQTLTNMCWDKLLETLDIKIADEDLGEAVHVSDVDHEKGSGYWILFSRGSW